MLEMSWIDDHYVEPPDENELLFMLHEDLKNIDDHKVWETRDGEEIEFDKLETNHIQNIIRKFKLNPEDMPNLFEELKKRSS